MDTLPPKPVTSTSLKEDDDRRRHTDERGSRYIPNDERSYVPRPRLPLGDSYVASTHYDRERDEDRYGDRYRDRGRDRRVYDARDRDRDRFIFDRRRDDTYIDRYDGRRDYRRSSPRRGGTLNVCTLNRSNERHATERSHRSRSPRTRRPYSPSPRYPPRSRYSRSPPSRRGRYNDQNSPSRSPRTPRYRSRERSPLQRGDDRYIPSDTLHARKSRSRSRASDHPEKGQKGLPTPDKASKGSEEVNKNVPSESRNRPNELEEGLVSTEESHTREVSLKESGTPTVIAMQPAGLESDSLTSGQRVNQDVVQLKEFQPLNKVQEEPAQYTSIPETKDDSKSSPKENLRMGYEQDATPQERSASPSRQPGLPSNQSNRDMPQIRRSSRSPPRGPRNHPRLSLAPSTIVPPRGRRLPLPSGTPTGPRAAHGSHDPSASGEIYPRNIPPKFEFHGVTASIDADLARIQSHRVHLMAENYQLKKGVRRALHELDMAVLDLRAAEARRKVADAHLEKARAGVLGVDATPDDSPVTA
ncbi:hypothetical protein AMATHDRAFT_4307 [Amanita thiersii Skay4041]|uniref:Uncharacterized protein n=1 Tax=Amanita thiersii Skay4041 TaxID=703135 RepID=A0A2A9NP70_9AGAR|nr:hypothetical protein AMATHDRAFT_4307 [Amanita thiersii Skay4041]